MKCIKCGSDTIRDYHRILCKKCYLMKGTPLRAKKKSTEKMEDEES